MRSPDSPEPEVFWHNVGFRRGGSMGISLTQRNEWWRYLLHKGQVSASFANEPGDRGEALLRRYVRGDRIVVYASGYGAVGWGIVDKPRYVLIDEGSIEDVFRRGRHRHRLKGISWKKGTENLEDAFAVNEIRKIGLHVPTQTRERIPARKARTLIELLTKRFRHVDLQTDTGSDDADIAQERSAGFQSDPAIRRAIEKYAMKKARKVLEAKGYDGFEETASYECYDYRCRIHGALRYVEVKGTQTDGVSVNLTHNEVEQARDHPNDSNFVLVHSIKLIKAGRLQLRNGTSRIREGWVPHMRDLKPLTYRWMVK